jgi:hypothetical protein
MDLLGPLSLLLPLSLSLYLPLSLSGLKILSPTLYIIFTTANILSSIRGVS